MLVSVSMPRSVIVGVAMIVTVRMPGTRHVRINQRATRGGGLLQFILQPLNHRTESHIVPQIRKHEWPLAAHLARIALHHFQ